MQGSKEPVRRKRKAGGSGKRKEKMKRCNRENGEKVKASYFPISFPSLRPHTCPYNTCMPAEDAGVGNLQRHLQEGLCGLWREWRERRREGGSFRTLTHFLSSALFLYLPSFMICILPLSDPPSLPAILLAPAAGRGEHAPSQKREVKRRSVS